jgi:hypothetical protein
LNRRIPLALLALLSGCFGQPEDLFLISGTVVNGFGEPWAGATVLLERDDGAIEQRCTGNFQSFVTLTTDAKGAFNHRVIRQQTRGRLSDNRCFRATVGSPDGRRTHVIWPFTGDDVQLPQLKLWFENDLLRGGSGFLSFGASVPTLPESWRDFGEGASRFTYRGQLDTEHGLTWRSPIESNSSIVSTQIFTDVGLGAQVPRLTIAAVQRIARYDRDPFGQLRAALFENRIETAPLNVPPHAAPQEPAGATCDLMSTDGGCVLTDLDPSPVLLPPGTRELMIDFGAPFPFGNLSVIHNLNIHRMWVEGPWTGLTVEMSVEDTPDFVKFATLAIDKAALEAAQISSDDRLPGLNFANIPLRGRELGFRRLRVRAVNQEQVVPIKSVGELSVFEN